MLRSASKSTLFWRFLEPGSTVSSFRSPHSFEVTTLGFRSDFVLALMPNYDFAFQISLATFTGRWI